MSAREGARAAGSGLCLAPASLSRCPLVRARAARPTRSRGGADVLPHTRAGPSTQPEEPLSLPLSSRLFSSAFLHLNRYGGVREYALTCGWRCGT